MHRLLPSFLMMYLSVLPVLADRTHDSMIPEPPQYLGGYDSEKYLEVARTFADTLIAHGRDVYGVTHTNFFLAMLDLSAQCLITEKDPNWDRDFNCEDYMRLARGANVYRDSDTLRALYALTDLTDDKKYREAADAEVSDLLRYGQSETTGLLAWGEHMVYNVLRDCVEHWRHEMEIPLPPMEQLWNVNSEAMLRYVDGIMKCHIYNPNTFDYDRHGHYYTGGFDDPAVRGKWIKHSGLFTIAFAFAYSKSGDDRYKQWALKITHNFWDSREGVADLPADLGRGTSHTSTQIPLLAWYLLHAYQYMPDPMLKEAAVHYMRRWARGAYDPSLGGYVDSVVLKDGLPGELRPLKPWGDVGWCELTGRTLALAAKVADDPGLLLHAQRLFAQYAIVPMPPKTMPHHVAYAIENALDLYELTKDRNYLYWARYYSQSALDGFFHNGLIRESLDGYIYNNSSMPGCLAEAWLRLYQVEEKEPCRWNIPDRWEWNREIPVQLVFAKASVPSSMECIVSDDDGTVSIIPFRVDSPKVDISIPSRKDYQGIRRIRIVSNQIENGNWIESPVAISMNSNGPVIMDLNIPPYIVAGKDIEISAKIEDVAGVHVARAYCELQSGYRTSVAQARTRENGRFVFALPTVGNEYYGTVGIWIEAYGNSDSPVRNVSEKFDIPVARAIDGSVPFENQDSILLPLKDLGVELEVWPMERSGKLDYFVALPPISSMENQNSLPGPCGQYLDIQIGDVKGILTLNRDETFFQTIIPEKSHLYRFDPGAKSWVECDSEYHADSRSLFARIPGDGLYVWSGPSRVLWKKATDGALLCSPAIADLMGGPELEIVLDTQAIDRHLRVFDYCGNELWNYEFQDQVNFPCLIDLDRDGKQEIVASSEDGTLVAFQGDGTVLWKEAYDAQAYGPAGGDIDGDGCPEVVCGWWDGMIRTYSRDWKWTTKIDDFSPGIPVLIDINQDKKIDVLIGGYDGTFVALDGPTGKFLWTYESPGRIELCASAGDLDGDGKPEIIFMSMPNRVGTLTCLNADGSLRWKLDCMGSGDWTPTLCDMNGDGLPDVLYADREGFLHIVNGEGKTIRRFELSRKIARDYMTLSAAPVDFNGDGVPDVLLPGNESRIILCKDGRTGESIWEYAPVSSGHVFHPAKCKLGGSPGIADLNGDGLLEVVVGDDLTWLHVLSTTRPCEKYQILSPQFHGSADRRGIYPVEK